MDVVRDDTDTRALDRSKQVFRFLKAFAERNVPLRRVLAEQPWSLTLRELPTYPSISITEVKLADPSEPKVAELEADDATLIRIRRPTLTAAPPPPRVLSDFLKPGWEQPEGTIEVLSVRSVRRFSGTRVERFDDDSARPTALEEWKKTWNAWAETERPAREAMKVFERFYQLHGRIELESERVELMLGDGRLRWTRGDSVTDHPVVLQRVEMLFDPDGPEFRIVDADRAPELFGALLQGGEALSAEQQTRLRIELEKGGYHPLEREGTSSYLRRLVQLLGPRGHFSAEPTDTPIGTDPRVERDAVLFLRARASGYAAAFGRVLRDLEERADIPVSLKRLVGVEQPVPDETIGRDDSPWSEPPDVLLSKPANLEQIQIARALERHRAVLVQGPPGTGKSHTIANLIGHLVAHGKRVLVTSHTTKALRVLRGQVPETLQPLCVALLENDLEGRSQMELAVRSILSRLTLAREEDLERQVSALAESRAQLNAEIDRLTRVLRDAREAEYHPIPIGGESMTPADAARWVSANVVGNDWIPGPLQSGAALPLSPDELRELYRTNVALTRAEEMEIEAGLPDLDALPSVEMFTELADSLTADEPGDAARFWSQEAGSDDLPGLSALEALVADAADALGNGGLVPWQRAIVAAGHSGTAERELWLELSRHVDAAIERWESLRKVLLERDVGVDMTMPLDEARATAREIHEHLERGRSLGAFTLFGRGRWKSFLTRVTVNGAAPTSAADCHAIMTWLDVEDGRRRLAVRWTRQAEVVGLPKFSELGGTPEPAIGEYARQFVTLLDWWSARWTAIEQALDAEGFRWTEFRAREVARSQPSSPFERDASMVCGPLLDVIRLRAAMARRAHSLEVLDAIESVLVEYGGPVCHSLVTTVAVVDPVEYRRALFDLRALVGRSETRDRRAELLDRLADVAPAWSDAIRRRAHGYQGETLERDATIAWRWRQLSQEIERRASLDEVALTQQLHQRRSELREITGQLIDTRAWLGQLRRTDLGARQALQGWADTIKRIGKGSGKRVPELQARARELLAKATVAVPVWIMPLSRVAENFDPVRGRFDVVIVDEASQSDITGLLAWYLGDRIVVVGDHEQVSPLAVGQQIDQLAALRAEHLSGVPNEHLYDGNTSVYDLARTSFGGTIALREHFRCVPDIIQFSNALSYGGEIRPLRDPSSVPRPHVAEYLVDATSGRSGKENVAEARAVAALLRATIEMTEFDGKSMGAITLLGDEQAGLIQELALGLVGAVELEKRRFAAGNSAQFQGDERHVMLLSMVDAPLGGGAQLTLRQTDAFKQRYNVAASRAKDLLWLVHSLDPARDLKTGDLRRQLIEHVRDPRSGRHAAQLAASRSESPFERAVMERLTALGYRVESQVWVGRYRLDMVVSDGRRQVALECDGDRFHGVGQIPEDMARQAVLERAGWRFVRIRGTRFYRAPDDTMARVCRELTRYGVEPVGVDVLSAPPESTADELRDKVVRRAEAIMREQRWLPAASAAELPSPT